MQAKKFLESLILIPYKIGGIKNTNVYNSFLRNDTGDSIINNYEQSDNQSITHSYFYLPAKLSYKTYIHVNNLYSNLIKDLFDPISFKYEHEKNIVDEVSDNLIHNDKKSIFDQSLYSSSYLKFLNNYFGTEEKRIEDWKTAIRDKYEIFTHGKNKKLKNKIIFDKIFIHLNYAEKAFDLNSQQIKHTDHIPSKKLYVFNYKHKEAPISKKFKVRLSFWINASDPLIIEKMNNNINKIHKDEMHHILLEFEDDIDELNYLKLFSKFSFVNIFMNMLNSKKDNGKSTVDEVLKNVKICDFDFFFGERDNFNKSIDKNGYNEYFYIKYL